MKFRFKVDQAACLRAGIDCPNSIVSIDVNPSELPQEDRDLIADRLYEGINVCPKVVSSDGKVTLETFKTGVGIVLIMGGRPDLDGLLTAVYNNEIVCDLCQGLTGNTFWDMEARIREKVPSLMGINGMVFKPGVDPKADEALNELRDYRAALDQADGDTAKACVVVPKNESTNRSTFATVEKASKSVAELAGFVSPKAK